MNLSSGTTLHNGNYRIIKTLGQGGFGITYLAEQVLVRRMVCIKEFFPKEYYNRDSDSCNISLGSASNAEVIGKFKSKFLKEAQTIATLDHPHVVHIFDVFEENNTCYYVMEYIDGISLSEMVKARGALSERSAVKYIMEVASALGYIHERKVNHLDVKPGNIMVQADGDSAILIDFGLSKHYDDAGDQTSSTPIGISHGYAPIEQYKAGGVSTFSPATDIYSLGATLYNLVTGKVPPQATDVGEEGLPSLPHHLSPNLCMAIERSMSYWRKQRPQTIGDFMNILSTKGCVVHGVDGYVGNEEKTQIAITYDEYSKIEKTNIVPKTNSNISSNLGCFGLIGVAIIALIVIVGVLTIVMSLVIPT